MFLKDSLQGCENTSDWLSEPEQIVKCKSPWTPCNQLLSYCKKLKKTKRIITEVHIWKKPFFLWFWESRYLLYISISQQKWRIIAVLTPKPLISKSKQTYSLYLTYLFHWHLSNIQTTVKTTTLKKYMVLIKHKTTLVKTEVRENIYRC